MFCEDKSAKASATMWLKVARALAKSAVEQADQGHAVLSVKTARAAEVAFWQATGQGDFSGLDDFLKAAAGQ